MMRTRVKMLFVVAFAYAGCASTSDPGTGATDGASAGTGDSGRMSGGMTTWASSWGTSEDTTPWNIDTEDPPTTTVPPTGGDEGSEESGFESDGTDSEGAEREEDFVGWFGYGAAVPGESYDAMGEVVVFLGGVDHCILIWTAASSEPDDGCLECEFAFRVTIGEVDAESEEDCALVDTDAMSLPGTVLGLGWDGEDLYTDFGGGYSLAQGAFAEYEAAKGQFFWELPLNK